MPAARGHRVLVRRGQPDTADHLAIRGAAGHDHRSVLSPFANALDRVEPELTLGPVRAVAVDAAPGQDWLHDGRIGDRLIRTGGDRHRGGPAGATPQPSADRGWRVLREIALAVRQRRPEMTSK